MTTQAPAIETPADGPPMRSAQEAFQNHEDRLQRAEAFLRVAGEAFPHLRDAIGADRYPHQFTADEMSGVAFDPNRGTIDTLVRENARMKEMLELILSRLPGTASAPSDGEAPAGPALPPAAPAW